MMMERTLSLLSPTGLEFAMTDWPKSNIPTLTVHYWHQRHILWLFCSNDFRHGFSQHMHNTLSCPNSQDQFQMHQWLHTGSIQLVVFRRPWLRLDFTWCFLGSDWSIENHQIENLPELTANKSDAESFILRVLLTFQSYSTKIWWLSIILRWLI